MPEKLPQRGEREVEKDPLFSVFLCSEMHESVIWKRSQEPLLGSFFNVQRNLQNPNSFGVVPGIFATFCRALELFGSKIF